MPEPQPCLLGSKNWVLLDAHILYKVYLKMLYNLNKEEKPSKRRCFYKTFKNSCKSVFANYVNSKKLYINFIFLSSLNLIIKF